MMNVLFCADSNVFAGIELALYTLLKYNKNVNIYVFTMNVHVVYNDERGDVGFHALNDWEMDKLRKIVAYLDKNSNICFIRTEEEYCKNLTPSLNEGSAFTPYAALRLITDIVLPDVDHLLYLDCDTAIQENLYSIYNECINGDKECYASYAYDACNGEGEMVSGVMIMNLRKMRENKTFEKARKYYKENKYTFPDQMALRDSMNNEIGRLPETYGYLKELELCGYKPAILHFTNTLSPKIYSKSNDIYDPRKYFYKKFPFLNYVKESCEMIDKINFTI